MSQINIEQPKPKDQEPNKLSKALSLIKGPITPVLTTLNNKRLKGVKSTILGAIGGVGALALVSTSQGSIDQLNTQYNNATTRQQNAQVLVQNSQKGIADAEFELEKHSNSDLIRMIGEARNPEASKSKTEANKNYLKKLEEQTAGLKQFEDQIDKIQSGKSYFDLSPAEQSNRDDLIKSIRAKKAAYQESSKKEVEQLINALQLANSNLSAIVIGINTVTVQEVDSLISSGKLDSLQVSIANRIKDAILNLELQRQHLIDGSTELSAANQTNTSQLQGDIQSSESNKDLANKAAIASGLLTASGLARGVIGKKKED
jgi:hypothetical protein